MARAEQVNGNEGNDAQTLLDEFRLGVEPQRSHQSAFRLAGRIGGLTMFRGGGIRVFPPEAVRMPLAPVAEIALPTE